MTRLKSPYCQVGDVLEGTREWIDAARRYESDGFIALNAPEALSADESVAQNVGFVRDSTRVGAHYVVIRAEMEGGGTGHGPHDVYPDGWHVTAKRLDSKGNWDPAGEEIDFYQSGCFYHMLERPKIVGKMRMMFVQATP